MRSERTLWLIRSQQGISSTVLIVLVAILLVNTVIGIFLVLNAQRKPSAGPVPVTTPGPGQPPTPQATIPGPAPTGVPTAAVQPPPAQPSPEPPVIPEPAPTQAGPPVPPPPTAAGPPIPPVVSTPEPPPVPPEPQPTARPTPPPVSLDESYSDPSHRFSISYPTGWRVAPVGAGFTSIYKDHPEEGTAFLIHPLALIRGGGARGMLRTIEATARKMYPDFEVVSSGVEFGKPGEPTEGGQIGRMTARWTNLRGERMMGRIWLLAIAQVSKATYISYQAPEIAFDSVERTFQEMYTSLEIIFPAGIKPPY